jgi:hypothetical protein
MRAKYDAKWKTPDDCGSAVCKRFEKCLDAHRYAAAKRKVVKTFLAHYWMVSRQLKGLPVEKPYILQYSDKHTHLIPPPEFDIRFDYGRPELPPELPPEFDIRFDYGGPELPPELEKLIEAI